VVGDACLKIGRRDHSSILESVPGQPLFVRATQGDVLTRVLF
jgi:hypothetical protein